MITISNIASFASDVKAQTDAPLIISPAGTIDTNQPVFTWTHATETQIQAFEMLIFAPDGSVSQYIFTPDQVVLDGENISVNFDETLPAGDYSWTVRSRYGEDTYSDYGQPLAFTVAGDLPQQGEDPLPTEEPVEITTEETVQEILPIPDTGMQPEVLAQSASDTFYVSPDGNDNNPGTEEAPWASIENSINRLTSGQTLYVRNGIYNETVTISVSGEAGNPINILAYPGETPVIDGNNYQLPSSDWAAMLKIEGSFINMSGFEVAYTNWMGVVITGSSNTVSNFNVHHNKENGILITGDDNVVENCTVWMNALSNENSSRTRGGWASGLSAARHPNNTTLRNNVVYQNWGEGMSTFEANGTLMEGNTVYNNYSANVYISDATNVVLQRNFVYESADSPINSGSRVGIMMGDEKYNPASSNIQIINNIVSGTRKNFYWWQGSMGTGMNNVLIANNTFVNSREDDNFRINMAAHQNLRILNNVIVQEDFLSIANINGTGISLANNLWSKTPGSAWLVNGSLVAEPRLAKTGSETEPYWFQLIADSPAIDHGTNLAEVPDDFARNPRTGTWDIGADEFEGEPAAVKPTAEPTTIPTSEPTQAPTSVPTSVPTTVPTTGPATVVPPTLVPPTATQTANPQPTPSSPSGGTGAEDVEKAVDIAKGKTSRQSSTRNSAGSNRAVDGNTDGSFFNKSTSHTKNNYQAWWQVDLGSVQSISTIDIWNRTDCCSSRLKDFYVLVSDKPFASTALKTARNQAGVSAYFVSGNAGRPTTIQINRTGRYVRVQLTGTNYLSLSEVQVWSQASTITEPTSNPPAITPTATAVLPTVTGAAPTATAAAPTATAAAPTATAAAPTATTQPTAVPTQSQPVSGGYYVATNGSDSNSGSQNAPWRTIQYAVNKLSAGQTLYVRGGVYREIVTISKSGASGNKIKILAYPGETPVIDGNNYALPASDWGVLLKITGSYLQVTGLEVRYSNWMGVAITGDNITVTGFNAHHNKENGILITGDNDIVENSTVWMNALSNQNASMSRGGWASGLSAARYPNNAIMRNNKVYQNWGEGLSTFEANGTIMEGNVVYDNYSTNIYISDATNILLQRNFIYATPDSVVNKGSRVGIMMGDEKYNPASSGIRILNNVVVGTYRNFYWWQGSQGGAMNNVLIANNTFVNSRSTTNFQIANAAHQNVRVFNNIIVQGDSLPIAMIAGSGITLSSNLWSKTPGSTAMGSNSIVANPAFAQTGSQASIDWYKLLSNSPAIDKGRSITDVSEDFTRYSRTGTLDIGAYEYR